MQLGTQFHNALLRPKMYQQDLLSMAQHNSVRKAVERINKSKILPLHKYWKVERPYYARACRHIFVSKKDYPDADPEEIVAVQPLPKDPEINLEEKKCKHVGLKGKPDITFESATHIHLIDVKTTSRIDVLDAGAVHKYLRAHKVMLQLHHYARVLPLTNKLIVSYALMVSMLPPFHHSLVLMSDDTINDPIVALWTKTMERALRFFYSHEHYTNPRTYMRYSREECEPLLTNVDWGDCSIRNSGVRDFW
jgi:hypothetical protein